MVRTTRRSATGACTFAPSAWGRTRTTSAHSDKATDHLRATAPVYSAEWGAKFSRHASSSSSSQGRLEQVGLSASFGIDSFLVPSRTGPVICSDSSTLHERVTALAIL